MSGIKYSLISWGLSGFSVLCCLKSLGSPFWKSPTTLEAQQIQLYQSEKWEQFFAQAIFYRLELERIQNIDSGLWSDRSLALEVMALTKHCQWEVALNAGQSSLRIAQKHKMDSPLLEDALALVDLHKNFPKNIKPRIKSRIPRSSFTTAKHWALKKNYLPMMKAPLNFRVVVSDLCAEGDES